MPRTIAARVRRTACRRGGRLLRRLRTVRDDGGARGRCRRVQPATDRRLPRARRGACDPAVRATPAVAEARAAIARRADAILDALYSNTNDTERSLALVAACRKRETSVYKDVRRSRSTTAFPDLGELVERLNLRHVYYWLGLAGAVGLIGGLGALAFK